MDSDTLPQFVDDASSEVEHIVGEGRVRHWASRQSSLFSQQDVGGQQLIHQVVEDFSLVAVSVGARRVLRRHLSCTATRKTATASAAW